MLRVSWCLKIVVSAGLLGLLAGVASAVNIEFVTVGNPGNAGELSGAGAGGYGPDRVCGAVDYTYRISTYEITAGQYCEFLNAVAAQPNPYRLYANDMLDTYGCQIRMTWVGPGYIYKYSVAPEWANRPVNNVSWGDAARFVNWLTNGQPTGVLTGDPAQDAWLTEDGSYYLNGALSFYDLSAVTRKANARYVIPTEDEWYKAAYYDPKKPGGAGYWDYPTGMDAIPSNILSDPDPGNNANFYDWAGAGTGDFTIGPPYYRTEVGAFANSASPYGTFDQGGNVREWTEGILYSLERGLRGGSYGSDYRDLRATDRRSAGPWLGSPSTGFRIVEVPEPATVAILALGGAGAFAGRRGRRRQAGGLERPRAWRA